MFTLIIVLAILWFAFIAPMKVTIVAIILALVVSTAVRFSAKAIAGATLTHLEALKAVCLSLLLVCLAIVMMFSFAAGAPSMPRSLAAISAPIVILGPLIGYTFGFKIALEVGILQSSLIAILSSGISIGVIFALNKFIVS